jgi:hypothetical protein
MKSSDFLSMAKQHLPYLKIEGKGTHVNHLNDYWNQTIIYWEKEETRNLKPFLEVMLTYYPDGYLKKSNKKNWSVFAEKHSDEDDWIFKKPFRTWL